MLEVYLGRRGPQPLGTVSFEELEENARERLKNYGGAVLNVFFFGSF